MQFRSFLRISITQLHLTIMLVASTVMTRHALSSPAARDGTVGHHLQGSYI